MAGLNITRNLAPGSTGPDVKQLQEWLKAQGFFPSSQTTTENYGPITQKAVEAWQRAFNVTQSDYGYFGPISRNFVQTNQANGTMTPLVANKPAVAPTQTSTPKTETVPSGGTPTPTVTPEPSTDTPSTSLQKALLLAVSDLSTSLAATGKPPISFADALSYAAKDPTIVAKYADMLKIDTGAFQSALSQLQTSTSTQQEQYKTQFENERKALAEKSAAAGQAYSGFRGKAQQDLAQTESGIVTSSRSQLQKGLTDMTNSFESKYGTAATPLMSTSFLNPDIGANTSISGLSKTGDTTPETISGTRVGGITGTYDSSKAADVRSKATDIYNLGQFPAVA